MNKTICEILGREVTQWEDEEGRFHTLVTCREYIRNLRKKYPRVDGKEWTPVGTPWVASRGESRESELSVYEPPKICGDLGWVRAVLWEIVGPLSRLAEFQSKRDLFDYAAAEWLLRYILGQEEQGLHYVSDGNKSVIAFGDASYASEWDYRSRSGGLATLAGGVIASYSERQRVPSTSTNEAESRCLSTIINVSKSIHNFLKEIPVHESNELLSGLAGEPPTIYIDNSATVLGANTNIFSRRQRHLEVKLAHINHEVKEGNVRVYHIRDAENSADINTKPKSLGPFKEKRDAIRNSTFVKGLKTVDTRFFGMKPK